ncbi:MAG: hypothetical protein ACM30I_00215 [Gemmatimonas sp.]
MRERGTSSGARLRAKIDAGRTGDKVPAMDPAAAPLGTDAEAAGTPLPEDASARRRSNPAAESGYGGDPRSLVSGTVLAVACLAAVGVLIWAVLP